MDRRAAFKGRQRKEIDMSTALATQQAHGLTLQTFDDAFRFAKMVSASDFAPKDFKGKPESCLLAIQHGSEVGLSPMQSLQSIAVINGRPTIWGDAALALVQASPACEYVKEFIEGEGKQMAAVCEVKRRGYPAPTVVRFSMADAEKAGLLGKSGPWSQYTSRMLALRARGFALRNSFADALRGLITAEEAQDYPQAAPTPAVTVTQPEPTAATVEPSVYQKAMQSIVRAKTLDRLDDIRRKVAERLADKSLTKWEHDELAKAVLDKASTMDNGTEHFDAQEVAAEAQAR
jgi:hypothetical protein